MSVEFSARIEERLKKELICWLTTVRADGTPQPTPVWFLWEKGRFVIYSHPNQKKLRNIASNPKVTLNLNSDEWGGNVLVITGEATVDEHPQPVASVAGYVQKYEQAIKNIGLTPERMAAAYTTAIHITPTHVRGDSE